MIRITKLKNPVCYRTISKNCENIRTAVISSSRVYFQTAVNVVCAQDKQINYFVFHAELNIQEKKYLYIFSLHLKDII
jgi:hypothetical protein